MKEVSQDTRIRFEETNALRVSRKREQNRPKKIKPYIIRKEGM
jgi:hypothetical protein